MSGWIDVYHSLPYPLRVLAASVRGRRLRRWRYGPETEQLVAEAVDREAWSPLQWKRWRENRLSYVLHRAATAVPFYRDYWLHRRRGGDRASWDVLENWPILRKERLRESPYAFVADDCDPRRMFHEHTSGTSGKPLSLWSDRDTVRLWYALFETRARRWNGLTFNDRWAILGGQLVAPFRQQRPPFWVWNAPFQQLYLSSYHLAPAHVPAYLQAMRRHGVRYIFGYASAMYTLARLALDLELDPPALRAAISNAEPLHEHQREAIARAFRCAVRDTYGMSEIVCAASECEAGQMHLWPEVGIIEVMHDDFDAPVHPGEEGRFVCTGLLNADMPLIRYELGDRGRLPAARVDCTCGRGLPVIAEIVGRLDDVVVTRDGRRIGRLDPAFKADLHIREAQVIQETLDRIRVKVVPAPGFSDRDTASIARALSDRVGEMQIIFEQAKVIPRAANGKFRAVVNCVAELNRESAG